MSMWLCRDQKFSASGVPSLKQFIREISKAVPAPQGGIGV